MASRMASPASPLSRCTGICPAPRDDRAHDRHLEQRRPWRGSAAAGRCRRGSARPPAGRSARCGWDTRRCRAAAVREDLARAGARTPRQSRRSSSSMTGRRSATATRYQKPSRLPLLHLRAPALLLIVAGLSIGGLILPGARCGSSATPLGWARMALHRPDAPAARVGRRGPGEAARPRPRPGSRARTAAQRRALALAFALDTVRAAIAVRPGPRRARRDRRRGGRDALRALGASWSPDGRLGPQRRPSRRCRGRAPRAPDVGRRQPVRRPAALRRPSDLARCTRRRRRRGCRRRGDRRCRRAPGRRRPRLLHRTVATASGAVELRTSAPRGRVATSTPRSTSGAVRSGSGRAAARREPSPRAPERRRTTDGPPLGLATAHGAAPGRLRVRPCHADGTPRRWARVAVACGHQARAAFRPEPSWPGPRSWAFLAGAFLAASRLRREPLGGSAFLAGAAFAGRLLGRSLLGRGLLAPEPSWPGPPSWPEPPSWRRPSRRLLRRRGLLGSAAFFAGRPAARDGVLQVSARAELRHRGLLDLHGRAGLRVAPHAGRTLDLLEDAEAGDGDLLALRDALGDVVDDRVERLPARLLGDATRAARVDELALFTAFLPMTSGDAGPTVRLHGEPSPPGAQAQRRRAGDSRCVATIFGVPCVTSVQRAARRPPQVRPWPA